jgi:predicted  nucleic acid-binding Zn-ribbon protein
MSASFDYDKALDEINQLLEDLQNAEIKIVDLERKVSRAKELITACEKELTRIENKIEGDEKEG